MRFLESCEIWEWCAERTILLTDRSRPADDQALPHRKRWVYATGERPGREPSVAVACVRTLGDWQECLVWILEYGVWPSSEDWPAAYAFRGAHSEKRSLDVAPGYLFNAADVDDLATLLTQVMENGWDAVVLPIRHGAPTDVRISISHDEWLEVSSREPVEFPLAAV